jgi:hypothetical protein
MHTHHHPTDDHGDSNIADENIQRLLASAYHPETPDKVFVQRLTAAMASVARERAEATSARLRTRPRARIGWAVAASVLVAAGGLLGYVSHGVFRKPVADAVDPSRTPVDGAELPVRKTAVDRVWPIRNAIVAAPRMPVDLVPVLPIGERLRTGPSERRRVPLPDGSLVYVNQNSALKLQADRQLLLERGEIYVEVAASAANGPDPDQPGAEPAAADEAAADTGGSRVGTGTGTGADATVRERFVVTTPNRELIALGTRFNVRASERQTAVAVTQGKVQVSGLDRPLRAGEQLAAMDGEIEDSRVTRIGQAAHLIDWTRELLVAAESPLVPVSHYAGGALVATLPDGQETRLSMRRYHVDVHLEDGFARTTIDQTYFNHKSSRLEGTFFFPLPPDASLSRLAMYVNGQLMEGGMAERDHARQVFETIVNRQKDPALLEWIDGSTFRMRVFPLEGRQEKRIVLSYTQRLPRLGERLQYRFPGGHSMPQVDHWTCQLRACGAAGCRWEADNYEFQETREGRDLVLRAAAEQIRPDRSLVVRMWDPDATERDQPRSIAASPDARFATVRHEGHRYLSLSCPFRPELPPRPRRRDWAFLFEASADRDPVLARTQIEIIKTLLENAEHEDTFVLLAAGTRVHAFADQPLPATPRNVKRAVRFLEATHLVGALDLENALRVAAASLDGAENPWLVQLGSGYPRLGEKSTDTLTALVDQRTRYVGVAVGNRWNRQWMQAAASRSAGHVTQINPDEAVPWRSIELLSRLNAPRLSGIRVNDRREALQFLTAEDFVCQDDELFAVARLGLEDPLPKSLEVTGSIDGEPYVQEVQVSDVAEDAGYLPRTWAKLEIDRMVAANPIAHRDAIVRLSMAMYVMSPFTSLLVLENEQMYEEFKVDRGRKDHWALYACPERIPIVHEPLKSPAAESVPKPECRRILETHDRAGLADDSGENARGVGRESSAIHFRVAIGSASNQLVCGILGSAGLASGLGQLGRLRGVECRLLRSDALATECDHRQRLGSTRAGASAAALCQSAVPERGDRSRVAEPDDDGHSTHHYPGRRGAMVRPGFRW